MSEGNCPKSSHPNYASKLVKSIKYISQLNKFLSSFYRNKDDCWNTGCLNRNCFKETNNINKEFSLSEPTIFGEKDLIDDLLKGNLLSVFLRKSYASIIYYMPFKL